MVITASGRNSATKASTSRDGRRHARTARRAFAARIGSRSRRSSASSPPVNGGDYGVARRSSGRSEVQLAVGVAEPGGVDREERQRPAWRCSTAPGADATRRARVPDGRRHVPAGERAGVDAVGQLRTAPHPSGTRVRRGRPASAAAHEVASLRRATDGSQSACCVITRAEWTARGRIRLIGGLPVEGAVQPGVA